MNSKIKTILLSFLLMAGLLVGNFSTAASLSVCGEGSYTGGKDVTLPTNEDPTAYDNYKAYQQWLIQNPMPTDPSKLDDYYKRRSAFESSHGICQASDIFRQIARIVNFLISFIGIFVIVRIVISGFRMVLSQGNEEAIKGARSGITNAIIGLILVFAAYIFVNIIFQIAGVQNFALNPWR